MYNWMKETYGEAEAIFRDSWRAAIWEPTPEVTELTGWAGFVPTPMQRQWLEDSVRIKMVAGGVRSGKSQTPPRFLDAFTGVRDGLIWIIGPDYFHARAEFKYLLDPYLKLNLVQKQDVSTPKEGMWQFYVGESGCRIETKSADDIEKIASEAPDAMLVTECGMHDEAIIDKIQERAIEKYAPVVLSGTFENTKPWYPQKWADWREGVETYPGSGVIGFKSYSMPTWSNTYVFPLGQNDPRFREMKANTPNNVYLERIEAIPYKPSGLVFREEYDYDTHVTDEDLYVRGTPVELAVDPATANFAVLFVQRVGESVHVLDEVYLHDVITQQVFPRILQSPYWPAVTGGVIDIAGKTRNANESVAQLFAKHLRINLRYQKVGIIEGINAVKLRLMADPVTKLPRLRISSRLKRERAEDGRSDGLLSEFDMESWPKDDGTGNEKRLPIDRYNHSRKALGYYLVDQFGNDVLRDNIARMEEQRMGHLWAQRGMRGGMLGLQ